MKSGKRNNLPMPKKCIQLNWSVVHAYLRWIQIWMLYSTRTVTVINHNLCFCVLGHPVPCLQFSPQLHWVALFILAAKTQTVCKFVSETLRQGVSWWYVAYPKGNTLLIQNVLEFFNMVIFFKQSAGLEYLWKSRRDFEKGRQNNAEVSEQFAVIVSKLRL